jgi:hypothetical protein
MIDSNIYNHLLSSTFQTDLLILPANRQIMKKKIAYRNEDAIG